jgi:hypothetical protein
MNEVEIEFSRHTQFLGESGYRKMQGVFMMKEITVEGDNIIMLPINKKGNTARCMITIPMEDLNIVIDYLIKIKNSAT